MGYEKEKIKKPKCPCENQAGKDVKDMKFQPCDDPPLIKIKCKGWEDQEIYPPCPCATPVQAKDTPKDQLLFPPKCKEVCKGFENAEVKIYKPCPPIINHDVCEEYKDAKEEDKIYKPKCPCTGQLGVKKDELKYYPDCVVPKYCVGYEAEKLVAPCPCAYQQGVKNMLYPPCPYPEPGPKCLDNENKCNCHLDDDHLDIKKYWKCACLNNKLWSRKICLCAEKPDHKDCECLPKNVALKPSLKNKCCKKNDKQYCECQDLYERYKGPTKLVNVEKED